MGVAGVFFVSFIFIFIFKTFWNFSKMESCVCQVLEMAASQEKQLNLAKQFAQNSDGCEGRGSGSCGGSAFVWYDSIFLITTFRLLIKELMQHDK